MIAPSTERFIVTATDRGFELSGLILQPLEDAPYVVREVIEVDKSWRTQRVELESANQKR